MKIAIVGSGAIGSYYGSLLAKAGEDVRFLLRSDLEVVARDGFRIKKPGGDLLLKSPKVYGNTGEIRHCDLVIIALKTTANFILPELLPPLLKKETVILTLQNGLGNEDFLSRNFGSQRVMGGLCFICLNRIAPGVVENFFSGYIEIGEGEGSPRERTRILAEIFSRAGIRCLVADSLQEARWRKLCWNIPFNGLAIAAGGIDTREILSQPGLVSLVWKLMRETQAIARALGFEIDDAFLQRQLDVTFPMGPYKPSSLIDYELGREVEVEAIWGEPVRIAEKAGVEAPCLQTLYMLLLSLCRRS